MAFLSRESEEGGAEMMNIKRMKTKAGWWKWLWAITGCKVVRREL